MKNLIRRLLLETTESTTLYHGTMSDRLDIEPNNRIFMATSDRFASDYGSVFQCQVILGKIFDSANLEHIKLLYAAGFKLKDPYLDDNQEELSQYDSPYDWENYNYPTAEAYLEGGLQDTWECIEKTEGVIEWIFRHGFDSIEVTEGGSNNYLLHGHQVQNCSQIS